MARYRLRGSVDHELRRERAASRRLRFESLLLRLSAEFVNLQAGAVYRRIACWLQRLAELIEVERASLWEMPLGGSDIRCLHFHSAPGTAPPDRELLRRHCDLIRGAYTSRTTAGRFRAAGELRARPVEGRASRLRLDARSALLVPLLAGSSLWIVALASVRRRRAWSRSTIRRLTLIGEIFAQAVLRQRAENARRLSEERFRGAFEHSAIGMAIVSLDGSLLDSNASLSRILGYSQSEFRGMTLQALTHPDDLPAYLEHLHRALDGEIDHFALEKRCYNRDGHEVLALLTASPVRGSAGQPLCLIVQLQDLSERAHAQCEIESLRSQLTHAGRLSILGQLAASLAHELLQPITAALADAEAARAHAATRTDADDLMTCLGDIVENIGRAGAVVNRTRGLLRREPAPQRALDVNQLARDVAQVMRGELVSRGVRLVMHLDPACPQIEGDPVALQQIIMNLILNGAEASQNTPPSARELIVTTSHSDQEVWIAVSDHGTGIAPQLLPRLFEPFFTTKPGGIGMGLAICSGIARAHGGRLSAENNPGAGMTFRLLLPVHCATSARASERSAGSSDAAEPIHRML